MMITESGRIQLENRRENLRKGSVLSAAFSSVVDHFYPVDTDHVGTFYKGHCPVNGAALAGTYDVRTKEEWASLWDRLGGEPPCDLPDFTKALFAQSFAQGTNIDVNCRSGRIGMRNIDLVWDVNCEKALQGDRGEAGFCVVLLPLNMGVRNKFVYHNEHNAKVFMPFPR